MATPNVLILEANELRENPSVPKGLNKNQCFKEPIKIDGYYFVPSGKPELGYSYDEKFVVSRKRLVSIDNPVHQSENQKPSLTPREALSKKRAQYGTMELEKSEPLW